MNLRFEQASRLLLADQWFELEIKYTESALSLEPIEGLVPPFIDIDMEMNCRVVAMLSRDQIGVLSSLFRDLV
jgi:hypothetical protein